VLNNIGRQSKRRKLFFVAIVALALLVGALCMNFRRYAYAVAWHCTHGEYAEVGGQRVRLPLLWWKEGTHAHDTEDLRDRNEWLARACRSNEFEIPEINVSQESPGEAPDADQDELRLTKDLVSAMYRHPVWGWSGSLVTLTPRRFTLYCSKDDEVIFGVDVFNGLTCHAAKIPYTFRYSGPPANEQEAEAILSSME